MTIGIAFSVKSDLGVSPVSSIPYSMTCIWGIEMGKATIIFHCVLVLIQVILLRRKFKIKNILQIIVGIIFGYFTTLCNWLVSFLPNVHNIVLRIIFMLLSTLFLAFGIFLYMPANIMPLAGEGAMQAVSDVTHINFAKVKIGFDVTMVMISLTCCLIFIKGLGSVGVGTIVAAILVGMILGVITKWFGERRDKLLGNKEKNKSSKIEMKEKRALEEGKANNNYVITISREYGSGGRKIGKEIAKQLGINYYDLEILNKMTKEVDITEAVSQEEKQSINNTEDNYLLNWYTQNTTKEQLMMVEKIYHTHSRIIREKASKESCVIVGRLANHILKDTYNCFNIFISADMDRKIKKVIEREGLTEEEANAKIKKVEKERENHCMHFANTEWRDFSNYDMHIKSNDLNFEATVKLIIETAQKKLKFQIHSLDK
ncbi:hypothetical protein PIROE2DRAFT_12914 [Piromyces sp. E2]|nr:hypothetical protein PIROE2DRAFT_12914 [Piromyces sp. E2]|eukprot:OUM61155.1 hypothetical protein PIROE2DRAFT_12914 [Piromyces sp. E2]